MQARLLRALEARVITPVGATEEVAVDVRLIAATNKDLEEAVTAGTFREDLRYRLDVVRIIVPPLRERVEDIIPLAQRFLQGFSPSQPMQLAPDAVAALRSHHWPGNVRELRNVMERIVATCATADVVRAADMGDLSTSPVEKRGPGLDRKVDDAEREAILEALATCGGNRTHAAKRLGISRRALLYRMEKLGLKAPPPSRRN
jgi:transcriptional regulator with PAS, ATPase and Fis domain